MKRVFFQGQSLCAAALVLVLLFMSGCGQPAAGGQNSAPEAAPSETAVWVTADPDPGETDKPSSSESPAEWQQVYLSLFETEFDRLHDSLYGGIAGVGFIDLDLDDFPELLVFDLGASASLGVQVFDVVEDSLVCVSAHIPSVGESFGGELLSDVSINCNYFDDFRLMQAADGSRFFCVVSSNASIDSSFTELIVVNNDNGVAMPESRLYEELEVEGGVKTPVEQRCAGAPCSGKQYEQAYRSFKAEYTDTGYAAAGVFVWERESYGSDYEGFMLMLNTALESYVPII